LQSVGKQLPCDRDNAISIIFVKIGNWLFYQIRETSQHPVRLATASMPENNQLNYFEASLLFHVKQSTAERFHVSAHSSAGRFHVSALLCDR